jgi:hypothetical protein
MTTTIEVPEGIDPIDLAALKMAFDQCRASDKRRAKQLEEMAEERGWIEAAEFAAYNRQIATMRLRPWQEPPCFIDDPNEPKIGEEIAARLLRRMLKAGISRWHPDPIRALEAVEAP